MRHHAGQQLARQANGATTSTLVGEMTHRYDVIASLQAPSLDELGRLVVAHVQLLDGVTRTLTCIVLHR
jgi:DNA-binding Lrp family transcriptional regulator